jgi:hypothetical protein
MREKCDSLFERLNEEAYNLLTRYLYNRNLDENPDYIRGRKASLRWLCDVTLRYMERHSKLGEEFEENLRIQEKRVERLVDGAYRDGIMDTIEMAKDILSSVGR